MDTNDDAGKVFDVPELISDLRDRVAKLETAAPAPADDGGGSGVLKMFADVSARLDKIEADNAAMRSDLEAAKNRGDVGVNWAQVQHVMHKYFPHDLPDEPATQVAPVVTGA